MFTPHLIQTITYPYGTPVKVIAKCPPELRKYLGKVGKVIQEKGEYTTVSFDDGVGVAINTHHLVKA